MKNRITPIFYPMLLALFFVGPVAADGTETGKIKNIIVEGSNIISIWLKGGDDFTADCIGGGRWTIAASDGLFKEKYKLKGSEPL